MQFKPDRWILALLCLLGAVWLGHDAASALTPGGAEDVLRQWRVCQYLRAGADPYHVAQDLLAQDALEHPAPHELYDVPAEVEDAEEHGLIPEIGVPCATYPPSAVALLMLPIGFLPLEAVRAVWMLVNLVFLGLLVVSLHRWPVRFGRGNAAPFDLLTVLALLLLWPPTHDCVRNSQFSIPITACLLWWMSSRPQSVWRTGLLMALALTKPSVSLPFLIVPLMRRQWKALGIAVGVHGLGVLGLAAWIQVSPLRLTAEWMDVAGYFMKGQYSLAEVLVALDLQRSPLGTLVTFGSLGAVMAWAWFHRRADHWQVVGWLCVGSLIWTYHGPYDFMVLLIPISVVWVRSVSEGALRVHVAPLLLALVAFLGVALLPEVFAGEQTVHRVLRWSGRLAFALLVGFAAVRCRVAIPAPSPAAGPAADPGAPWPARSNRPNAGFGEPGLYRTR